MRVDPINSLLTILKQWVFIVHFGGEFIFALALQLARGVIGNQLRAILECAQRRKRLQRRIVIAAFGFVQRFGVHRHLRRVLVAAELLELRGGLGVFALVQHFARGFVRLFLAVAARDERECHRDQYQHREDSLLFHGVSSSPKGSVPCFDTIIA